MVVKIPLREVTSYISVCMDTVPDRTVGSYTNKDGQRCIAFWMEQSHEPTTADTGDVGASIAIDTSSTQNVLMRTNCPMSIQTGWSSHCTTVADCREPSESMDFGVHFMPLFDSW